MSIVQDNISTEPSEAYKLGWEAGWTAGVLNPFTPDTTESNDWEEGFECGRHDANEAWANQQGYIESYEDYE